MCGIAGIYNVNENWIDAHRLKKMCDIQKYRGPDDEGYYFNTDNGNRFFERPPESGVKASIGLGHRRLSIIDLTRAGRQPMSNESGSIWLIYNGELYNYREIKNDLSSLGHKFQSSADSEVIIHAYEEWGSDCLRRFNGMWAFAIWDERYEELFLARDRFGIKPFYYFVDDKEFIFASEIKAILSARPDENIPNIPYAARFIAYGIMDDKDETFFRNIKALPPGHFMTVSKNGVKIEKYWELSQDSLPNMYAGEHSLNDLDEQFLYLLEDSVKVRLMSDAPLGFSLSGGLDSSSITMLASKYLSDFPTFTAAFDDKSCDESRYASEVAQKCKAQQYFARPGSSEFMDFLLKMVWHLDEPCAAYGTFPQWNVMREASGHVKVLLDGQGGDEILGGYHHFFPHYLTASLEDQNLDQTAFNKRLKSVKDMHGRLAAKPYEAESDEKVKYRSDILAGDIKADLTFRSNGFKGPFANHLDNVMFFSLTRDVLPGLLHYQDRISMAFSIESRVPFLDYRLVEFCYALPYSEKISGPVTKSILRDSMKGILPEKIRARKDKQGYPVPLGKWIRCELQDAVKGYFDSDRFRNRGILNTDIVNQRLDEHIKGEQDHTWEIWRWLTLEVWFREFVDC